MAKRGNQRQPHKFINETEHKRCPYCKEWRTLDSFHRYCKAWDKLQGICKQCRKVESRN